MQQGVAAHKEGKLQEAERLYKTVLQAQPQHPDANHNLGLIEVSMNRSGVALPLFKNAIRSNPTIEQFWLSYIEALITERQFEDAKKALKKGKKKSGAKDKLNALTRKLILAKSGKSPSQAELLELTKQYQNRNYDHAEKLAILLTQHFPEHQFGWKILGAILGQTGRMSESLGATQKSLALKPADAEAHYNQGNILKQLGRLGEAEASYRQAIKLKFGYVAHNNLGTTLRELGRLKEAEASYRKVIALKSDSDEAHCNLGITLQELGRLDEAEASYRQAIILKPDFAEAHNSLGNTLQELGKLDEAEASYRQAIMLKPDFARAFCNMGITLQGKGDLGGALESYIKALEVEPDHPETYANLAIALGGTVLRAPNSGVREIITSMLDHKNYVRPRDISTAAISLLKFEPTIKSVIEMLSAGELRLSLQNVISDLSDIPLLLKLMSVCPLADLELEAVLTNIRSGLLSSVSKITGTPKALAFQSALALHCFTNEYVYVRTFNDVKALEVLEAAVKKDLLKGEQPSPQAILCLASWKGLLEYEWCDLLTVTVHIEDVFTRQVSEPTQEASLKLDIPTLQEITDNVSSRVREQYEENPFPRWVSLGLPFKPSSVSEVAKHLELNIFDLEINSLANPKILIAGCGTGQQSIGTAATFKNSTVLAVDLSLASLAYAKRKTQELGVLNVEYVHADILDLGKLDRQFDIVESLGVLHHMDEPMAGWKVLTDCLKLGGLMRIGLYSELARQDVARIREQINQSGIDASDDSMRLLRRNIINSNEEHHERILKANDFYSLSELRDLLFHVQEHRFNLPQIQHSLSELGLNFCGFETEKILHGFKLTNVDKNDPYDLNKWNYYEEANPNTFSGMYQFWCQKVA